MHFSTSISLTAASLSLLQSVSAYTLVQKYDSTNFFNEFSFYTGSDPTGGSVDYISKAAANSDGLAEYQNGQVYLGVDHTTKNPAGGRASVRLSSNTAFTQGLFIADIAHMPGGICGTWPAFWMFGPNWPASGEIDIIEGVNAQTTDQITLHTAPGCSITNANSLAGTSNIVSNCNAGSGGTGCGASTSNTNNYGAGFNAVNGGVYAMQWTATGVYVWFWQRNAIPADINNNKPNVAGWGTPLVSFSSGNGGCNFGKSFANHNIIFDTTFCGQWAGQVWGSGSCASKAASCNDFVAQNPAAFVNAYWLINSVKVYQ